MFCVSSVDTLIDYYDIFERLQAERQAENPAYQPLTIATIFSYAANEERSVNEDAQNGLLDEESTDIPTQYNLMCAEKTGGFNLVN